MRRLKQELKQTMDMYSTACKEALTAREKACETHCFSSWLPFFLLLFNNSCSCIIGERAAAMEIGRTEEVRRGANC